MSEQVQSYFNMYNSLKMMLNGGMKNKNMKHSDDEEVSPINSLFDRIDTYSEQIGTIISVMSPEYEGSDFCQGLTVSFEAKSVALQVASGVF